MDVLTIILILIFSMVLFAVLIKIDWWVREIRDIAQDKCGYTKLIQMGIAMVLIFVFLVIVIYYLKNPGKVDRIDIILTVVVGWLGAIIGNFFGDKSMDNLEKEKKSSVSVLLNKLKIKDAIIKQLDEKLEKQLKTK